MDGWGRKKGKQEKNPVLDWHHCWTPLTTAITIAPSQFLPSIHCHLRHPFIPSLISRLSLERTWRSPLDDQAFEFLSPFTFLSLSLSFSFPPYDLRREHTRNNEPPTVGLNPSVQWNFRIEKIIVYSEESTIAISLRWLLITFLQCERSKFANLCISYRGSSN